MKHFSKWGIAPIAFVGALLLGLLLVACPAATTPGGGGSQAVVDNCETTTDSTATNILVLFGDGTWDGYEGTDCSEVTYSGAREQAFHATATTTEVEDLTTGCYEDTPNCISLNRVGGDWGGWHYSLDPTVDVTSFQSLCLAYKLEASSDAVTDLLRFRVVLEDEDTDSTALATTQSQFNVEQSTIMDDDTWGVLRIARSGFSVPGVHDEVDNFGIWNTTDGEALVIDEVYFSSAATCLP